MTEPTQRAEWAALHAAQHAERDALAAKWVSLYAERSALNDELDALDAELDALAVTQAEARRKAGVTE